MANKRDANTSKGFALKLLYIKSTLHLSLLSALNYKFSYWVNRVKMCNICAACETGLEDIVWE